VWRENRGPRVQRWPSLLPKIAPSRGPTGAKLNWREVNPAGRYPSWVTVLRNVLSKFALNVCLMAVAYGVRSLGPSNLSHHERLKPYAKLARKRGREQQEKA
jgi:hypothetical protein